LHANGQRGTRRKHKKHWAQMQRKQIRSQENSLTTQRQPI
jgi:hypothetical protein